MRYCKFKRVTALCLLEEPIDEKEWISLDVEQHRIRSMFLSAIVI